MGFFRELAGALKEGIEEAEKEAERAKKEEKKTVEKNIEKQGQPSKEPHLHDMVYSQQKKADTVISKETTIIGALKGEGNVRVEGLIDGEVDLNGSLIIATTGTVKDPITVNILDVAGNIEGNVKVKERLCLERTGYIQGDVETVSLVIDEGGRLNGRTLMTEKIEDVVEPVQEGNRFSSSELQFGPDYPSPGAWDKIPGEKEDKEEEPEPETASETDE